MIIISFEQLDHFFEPVVVRVTVKSVVLKGHRVHLDSNLKQASKSFNIDLR